jgi:peptidoglycan/xylan/chitin deacetylase (PgdA/CDA1 family)
MAATLSALPPVLVYHKIDDGFELGVNVVKPAAFASQMRWLADGGFAGVSLADALDRDAADGPARGKAPVVLTFDDGYESVLRHALPLLDRLGFQATLFVPSAYVGARSDWDTRFLARRYRHLDRAGLRALADAGWEIGSHSATHADLRRVSDARLADEVAGSRAVLEEIAGAPVRAFAYPFGRFDERVRRAVAAAGYRAACGGRAGAGRAPGDRFAIPRLGVRSIDGLGALRAKIVGGRGAALERLKETVAHAAAGGTPWAKSWLPFS